MNNILYNLTNNRNKSFYIFLLLLSILSIYSAYSYQPYNKIYAGDDIFFHYRRFSTLMEALSNGTFPFYIDNSALMNFGYITKWFYPDLILIPFAIIGNFTNLFFAYRLLIIVMTFLCGLFTYLLMHRITKNKFAAITGSIIYTFSFYRLFDLYSRSASGESIAFTFIPLIFLGLFEIISGNYKRWYIITIGFTLLIYTHLLSTLLTAIFVVLFLLIYIKRLIKEPKRLLYLILAGIITIFLVASYLLPILEQIISNDFYYKEMLILPHTRKLSITKIIKGTFNGFTLYQYNFLPGIGAILAIIALSRIFITRKGNKYIKLADISLTIGIICIILTAQFIPWARFPFTLLNIIQFPWRLIQLATFFIALSGSYYLSILINNYKVKYITIGIIILATIIMINIDSYNYHSNPELNYSIGKVAGRDIKPTSDNNYHIGNMEYVPKKFTSYPQVNFPDKEILNSKAGKLENKNKETTIIDYITNSYITTIKFNTNTTDTLEIPKFYYKGYFATLNGDETELLESNIGLINIPVNKSGEIKLWYRGTDVQRISYIISSISFFLFIIYIIFLERKQKKNARISY